MKVTAIVYLWIGKNHLARVVIFVEGSSSKTSFVF